MGSSLIFHHELEGSFDLEVMIERCMHLFVASERKKDFILIVVLTGKGEGGTLFLATGRGVSLLVWKREGNGDENGLKYMGMAKGWVDRWVL